MNPASGEMYKKWYLRYDNNTKFHLEESELFRKIIEHKLMEYQFYSCIIIVSIYYAWCIDLQFLLASSSLFDIRWLPFILLIFSGILYKASKHLANPQKKLFDSIRVVRKTILDEGGKISFVQLMEHAGEKFLILVEFSEGQSELFTVERKVIIERRYVPLIT